MRSKKIFLVFLGVVLILASLFPLVLMIVSFQGDMEAATAAAITGGVLFAGLLLLSILSFRAARRIIIPRSTPPATISDDGRYPDIDASDLVDPVPAVVAPGPTHTPAPPPAPARVKPARPSFWSHFQVDYVLIANSSSRAKAGSAIARGAVGGLLLGPIGLLAAGSAKRKSYLDLIVHYKSGRVSTQRVKVNSLEYHNLARYIRA